MYRKQEVIEQSHEQKREQAALSDAVFQMHTSQPNDPKGPVWTEGGSGVKLADRVIL